MIPLPDSLTLGRDVEDEKKLLSAARSWLEREERPKGIHASDLLDPRKAYYRLVDPKGTSDRDVPIFLVGKVLHAFVLGSLEGKVDLSVTDEGAQYDEELGLWYSPDWDKGEIAEFKTSRRFYEPQTAGDIDTYLEQVLVYMAAKKRRRAKLWVLFLNRKDPDSRRTSPEFRAYTIDISEEDLGKLREHIQATRAALEKAIAQRNPADLPLCREWLCGPSMCPWWEQCKPAGRYEVDPSATDQTPPHRTDLSTTYSSSVGGVGESDPVGDPSRPRRTRRRRGTRAVQDGPAAASGDLESRGDGEQATVPPRRRRARGDGRSRGEPGGSS